MRHRRRHILILGLICLFFTIPILTIYSVLTQAAPRPFIEFIADTPFISTIFQLTGKALIQGENAIRDSLAQNGRKTPADPRLVYVAIDNSSLTLQEDEIKQSPALMLMAQSYPWQRSTYTYVLDRLFQAGARVVAIDLLFLQPSLQDQVFKETLDRYRDKVVIGCNFVNQINSTSLEIPTDSVIPQTHPLDDRIAFINFFTEDEENSIVRRTQYRIHHLDQEILSFAAKAIQKFGSLEEAPRDSTPRIIRFGGPAGTYSPIPVWQLFYPSFWENNLHNGEIFKDKIVVFGPHANWGHDEHPTPLGMMPGPEIHLHAIAAALHNSFIHELPLNFNLLLMPLSALIAWAFCFIFKNPLLRLGITITLALVYFALLQFIFDHLSFYILSLPPVLIFSAGGVTCLAYEFLVEQIARNRTRATLERYVSKNVVQQLLDHSKDYEQSLGGARKNVTILFSDIRGFTTMTESADSQELVKQLNEYLTEMVECVFNHQGTLDKFIGDAVMAVWGNTVSHGKANDASHALHSALAMRRALEKLNQKWKDEKRQQLHIGIGLNHGEVIIGNMGSPKRMEFTAIGDAVNLASRLEGLTKEYHLDLLIGENVAHLIRDQFHIRTVALVQVKGKTKPVEVFTVLDKKEILLSESQTHLLNLYEQGITLYRSRKFQEASQIFSDCIKIDEHDFLSQFYLDESNHLAAHPPDESWNGVNIKTTK